MNHITARLLSIAVALTIQLLMAATAQGGERLRVIIETDAGGDPDDEQSLVRFLLYANEWDLEGIIANRPHAREGENRNPERTGLGVVRRMIDAYEKCYTNLKKHDSRYPDPTQMRSCTVAGYDDVEDGVALVIRSVDSSDARPVWFLNWGTDNGAAVSCLKRALDRVLRERGRAGYEKFKARLRLSSADKFGEHTFMIGPPFPFWVDTFRPELGGKRWYHRFSALTMRAGGFDLQRDVLNGHGPIGALYPTNTTHRQKEGDTMTFLYLVPNGLNDPNQPGWGSWAGRYGRMTNGALNYFWANQVDEWSGTTNRDNTLARWAAHLQNDFRARLDWCVTGDFLHANYPPSIQVAGGLARSALSGDTVTLDAAGSTDPDGQSIRFEWICYPEETGYSGTNVQMRIVGGNRASFVAPEVTSNQSLHVIVAGTDTGTPPLTRYARVSIAISPRDRK